MTEHWSFKQHDLPPGEPVLGKTYRADGWQYIDLPKWLSLEMKDYFLKIIGEDNYFIMAHSERVIEGEKYWRAQLLVSPDGQNNMRTASFRGVARNDN